MRRGIVVTKVMHEQANIQVIVEKTCQHCCGQTNRDLGLVAPVSIKIPDLSKIIVRKV